MLKKLLIIFGLIPLLLATDVKKIDPEEVVPSAPGMTPCPINDPNRDKCFNDLLQNVIPNLKGGYKPFGIEPIDPCFVDKVNFNFKFGPLDFKARPRNITFKHFSELKIKSARTELRGDSFTFELDLSLSRLLIQTKYFARGKYEDLVLKSKGKAIIKCRDFTTTAKFKAVAEERNGEKYMNVNKMDGTLKMRKIHFNATGLVPDPNLNEVILEFANQNTDHVKQDLVADSKYIWDKLVMDLFHGIVSRVPFRRIFPSQ